MKPILLTALTVSALAAWNAHESWQFIDRRIYTQQKNLDELRDLERSYAQLAPVQASWQGAFQKSNAIPDVRTAIRQFDLPAYGLTIDRQRVHIQPGKPDQLGLYPLCMTTGSANRVTVTAHDIGTLLTGLEALAQRHDISFSGIQVRQPGGYAEARLEQLCMHVRAGGQNT